MSHDLETPLVSVIVLNYNGKRWLERCMETLARQTLLDRLEILVADNASTDGSDELAGELCKPIDQSRFLPLGGNYGYCKGNNLAAQAASGEYLFFLNNDTWLEDDCLEQLLAEVGRMKAAAGCPLVLNYNDDSFQSGGAFGMDVFGLPTSRIEPTETAEVLMPEGCAYLIQTKVFRDLGGFDEAFFMYSDEYDLSIRLWLSGGAAISVPQARLHHWGAAQVNPGNEGGQATFRTSESKRYYANRNALLTLLKNGQDVLLLMAFAQILMLLLEMVVGWAIIGRWSFVKRAYLDALRDCWKKRVMIQRESRKLAKARQRDDLWMLKFLKLRPNRLDEIKRMRELGPPEIAGH